MNVSEEILTYNTSIDANATYTDANPDALLNLNTGYTIY